MKAAIVGTPGSGRKTLMTALAEGDASQVQAGRKSMLTIRVPDERIDWLSSVFKPKKTTYATLEVALDDSPYDSLGKRLNALRASEVLVLVAGGFGLGEDGAEAVLQDVDKIVDEMVLADQLIVEKRVAIYRKTGDKGQEAKLFERLLAMLEEGRMLSQVPFIEAERQLMVHYGFLTLKPLLVVANIDEEELANPIWARTEAAIRERGAEPITLCAALEAEVATLEPEEQVEFLESIGLTAPASHRLVQSVYRALDLISFFTVGEDEVRAWPVRANQPAPVAGGRIHSDIQRGFIRAEVVSYPHFQETGSLAAARRTGRLRTEGKAYIVQDGDIMNFLFNV